jgi:hypothetical protein
MSESILYIIRFAIILVVSVSGLSSNTQAQNCNALEGRWENELGSILVVEQISSTGQIIGEYKSSSGVDGKVFPLLGWVNNYNADTGSAVSIAFSVKWEGYSSITSWTGTCSNDEEGPKIKTLWHLVRPNQEFEWERIIANSSTFRPVSK